MTRVSVVGKVDAPSGYKNGVLNGTISLSGQPDAGTKMSVVISVAGEKTKTPLRKTFPVKDTLLQFTVPMTNPRLWSAEMPVLYEVKLRMTDTLGRALDSTVVQAPIRSTEERNGKLYYNGRQIWIKGMEQSTYDTPVIRRAKLYNINAVHGKPGDEGAWRKLCDQYGLYVVDDTSGFVPSLFAANGQALPMAAEVKQIYQPVRTTTAFTKVIPGVGVRVYNNYVFRDLSHLTMEWQLVVNGVTGRRGTTALPPIAAQQSAVVNIPVPVPAGETLLNIYYRQKKAEAMIPAGYVVAAEQLAVSNTAPSNTTLYNDVTVHPAGELTFKDEGGSFGIGSTVTGLDMQFNKQTGWLQHYAVGGRILLNDTLGLTAGFFQIPWSDSGHTMTVWKNAGADARLQLFSTSTSNDFVIVRADYMMPETGCMLHVHYTVNAKGEMQVEDILEVDTTGQPGVDTTVRLIKPPLPRMGMQWSFLPGYDSVIYYGRGPQENYADRHAAAFAGVYRQTMEDARPRTDVRWWKVTDKQGHGLQFSSDSAFLVMNAVPGAPAQLHIDHRQMDLAGRGLPYGNYHYIYKVTPL